MLSVTSYCTEVRWLLVATTNPRVHLTFNEYDFRHRKVLEILRSRPRNQTELTVNAILHYISCPEAEVEFGKDTIRKVVREVIMEMQVLSKCGLSCQTGKKLLDDADTITGRIAPQNTVQCIDCRIQVIVVRRRRHGVTHRLHWIPTLMLLRICTPKRPRWFVAFCSSF